MALCSSPQSGGAEALRSRGMTMALGYPGEIQVAGVQTPETQTMGLETLGDMPLKEAAQDDESFQEQVVAAAQQAGMPPEDSDPNSHEGNPRSLPRGGW
ncbi:MAG: hypothetical protein GY822_18175 [Deltaproteobacteria bacterium]|nr:hypothetical protein [Deltaproteobacteria bacterium]